MLTSLLVVDVLEMTKRAIFELHCERWLRETFMDSHVTFVSHLKVIS